MRKRVRCRSYKGFTEERIDLLSPQGLEAFVRGEGFSLVEIPSLSEEFVKFYRDGKREFDIMIPFQKEDSSYFLRYVEAIHDMAEYLDKSPEQVFQLLLGEGNG